VIFSEECGSLTPMAMDIAMKAGCASPRAGDHTIRIGIGCEADPKTLMAGDAGSISCERK